MATHREIRWSSTAGSDPKLLVDKYLRKIGCALGSGSTWPSGSFAQKPITRDFGIKVIEK